MNVTKGMWLVFFFFFPVRCCMAQAPNKQSEQSTTPNRYELFGGYSYLSLKPGPNIDRANLNGWTTSAMVYVFGRLGIAADFAGHYGTKENLQNSLSIKSADLRQHSFLAGPQVRVFRRRRFSTSFRALFGVSRGETDLPDSGVQPESIGINVTHTKFAASIGNNIDFNLSKSWAVRVQPSLFLTHFGGDTDRQFRASIGIVYRFGSQ